MIFEVQETKLCPLCKKDNDCGMNNNSSAGACWCFEEAFPIDIFNQLPIECERICICENCLKEFSLDNNIIEKIIFYRT